MEFRSSLALPRNDKGMSPEVWRRIKDIFDAAVELPAADRGAYIAEAAGGDAQMLAELKSLLSAHDDAGDFIDVAPPAPPDKEYSTGMSIGPYRIVQVIGEGG